MGLSVSYEPTEWEEGGGGERERERGMEDGVERSRGFFFSPRYLKVSHPLSCVSFVLIQHHSDTFSSALHSDVCVCVCEKDHNVFIQLFIVIISLNKSNTVTALIRSVPGRFLYLNIHGFRQVAHFHHIWRLFLHFKAVMTQGWLHGVRNPVCSDYSWVLPPLDLCQ